LTRTQHNRVDAAALGRLFLSLGVKEMMQVSVRHLEDADRDGVVRLIADFRVELNSFRGHTVGPDCDAARDELREYETRGYPVTVVEIGGAGVVAYLVCRIDATVVWVESLFVSPRYRRQGIASLLYNEAEAKAHELGGKTVFNWVHPNNTAIIQFLRKRGYSVLNLIELRKPIPGEHLSGYISVGEERFEY
jgi:ribosomal protein S18 acetylase RimI-like enzyme